jgi:hypothetical protein
VCVLQVVAFLTDIRARYGKLTQSPSYDIAGNMYIKLEGIEYNYAVIRRTQLSDELTRYDYYYNKKVAKDVMR